MSIEEKLQVIMLIEQGKIEEARKLAFSFGSDDEEIDYIIAICQGLNPNDVVSGPEPTK